MWDYIFLNGKYPGKCGVPQKTLDKLKAEFEFWYPLDLRVSGKDLIGNHLTMSLYNHAAVWVSCFGAFPLLILSHLVFRLQDNPKMWPQSFYTNGHLMVCVSQSRLTPPSLLTLCLCVGLDQINAEKMSKSTGNFLTLKQAIDT